MVSATSLAILLVGVVALYATHTTITKRRLPAPPGPRTLPLVGNFLDIPKTTPWLVYRDMCKTFGSLISLEAFGNTMLIVGDFKTATELVEKRSVYASRPKFNMVRFTGWEWSFVFSPYGQFWRQCRRVFWQYFRPEAIAQHRAHQEDAVRRLLHRLLETPENVEEHLRYSLGVTIIGSTYGLKIAKENDENISCCDKALSSVECLVINGSLVEHFPFLARLPTWLPGTGFLRQLAEIRRATRGMLEMPWSNAKEEVRTGQASPSIARSIIDKLTSLDDEAAADSEAIAQSSLGAAYAAGLDTQYAALQRFFLAMALYPEAQKKAQAELDAVVGTDRLPDLSDRDALQYVNAVVKETLRWYTVVPLGVPHCTTEEDEYNGYYIPKDATVLVNIWAISNDPRIYPEPDRFIPDRYLKDGNFDPNVRDPATIVFGFGRRICPGRYFAEATMFLFIASVLSAFEITPMVDDDGRPVHIQPRQATGIISHLEDWRCVIEPRSVLSERLVRKL
ncbi:cytochrome P450 98A3 [Daedaleopsis nitida]|nr:cytochrome P450 98A3 [Daedaleopsis nitida]